MNRHSYLGIHPPAAFRTPRCLSPRDSLLCSTPPYSRAPGPQPNARVSQDLPHRHRRSPAAADPSDTLVAQSARHFAPRHPLTTKAPSATRHHSSRTARAPRSDAVIAYAANAHRPRARLPTAHSSLARFTVAQRHRPPNPRRAHCFPTDAGQRPTSPSHAVAQMASVRHPPDPTMLCVVESRDPSRRQPDTR